MAFRTASGSVQRAFTLIELLVVMVIIASLLAIAVPKYFRSLDRSKEVVLQQDLVVMREAIDQFYGDRGAYPSSLVDLVQMQYIRKLPVDPLTKSADTWVTIDSNDSQARGIRDVKSGAKGQSQQGVLFSEF